MVLYSDHIVLYLDQAPVPARRLSGKMDVRLAMEDVMRAEWGVVTGLSVRHMPT